jgi:hypothetical protein
VDKETYSDVLRRHMDAVRRKKNQQMVSPSRQCSGTPVDLGKGFLAKDNVTTLEHSPCSPDLVPADFYLFPRLKPALKGRRFCVTTDIIKNATEELKSALFSTPFKSLAEGYNCTKGLF